MSILKPKNHDKTRTLSVRLPADLLAQVEALRADADAAGHVFDVAEVVGRALGAAVKSARAELDAICVQDVHKSGAGSGEALAPSTRDAQQRNAGGASGRRESAPGTASGGDAG